MVKISSLAKLYQRLFIRKFDIDALLHLQLNSNTMINSHLIQPSTDHHIVWHWIQNHANFKINMSFRYYTHAGTNQICQVTNFTKCLYSFLPVCSWGSHNSFYIPALSLRRLLVLHKKISEISVISAIDSLY